MNKQELAQTLSEKTGLPYSESKALLNASISVLTAHLVRGESVIIRNFGSFSTALKAERRFFNPISRLLMQAPKKIAITFHMAKLLAERINKKARR
ncbi:hypothetical protein FACS189487_02570 [Campylobacterota bacterium]|nr:hypothetical protein FACS189487_02570 [Campylobacterota bacterium]